MPSSQQKCSRDIQWLNQQGESWANRRTRKITIPARKPCSELPGEKSPTSNSQLGFQFSVFSFHWGYSARTHFWGLRSSGAGHRGAYNSASSGTGTSHPGMNCRSDARARFRVERAYISPIPRCKAQLKSLYALLTNADLEALPRSPAT